MVYPLTVKSAFGVGTLLALSISLTSCISTPEGGPAGEHMDGSDGFAHSQEATEPTYGEKHQGGSFDEANIDQNDISPFDETDAAFGDVGEKGEWPVLYFGYDRAAITETARAKLLRLAEQLQANEKLKLQIQGHCDERGSTEYNLALGDQRAEAVRAFLVNLGVDRIQLTSVSFGEEQPAEEGHDEAAWAKNRRVEFRRQAFSHH